MKIRWENSIDGSNTTHRTFVSYKILWRMRSPARHFRSIVARPRCARPGRSKACLWRNTRVAELAASASTQLGMNTLGYEWADDRRRHGRASGLRSNYASELATHSLVQYRAASGALVFGAGTAQWSWGLGDTHDRGSTTPDTAMAQATVHLFADTGSQSATIRGRLTVASASTDTVAPTSVITSPVAGGVTANSTTTNTGTTAWSYSWRTPPSGSVTIQTRAVDDSCRLEVPSSGVTVTVGGAVPVPGPVTCPCALCDPATVPVTPADSDASAVELGTRFRADATGAVTGMRFYKGLGNTGTHTGRLWAAAGALLVTATYTGKRPAVGSRQTSPPR